MSQPTQPFSLKPHQELAVDFMTSRSNCGIWVEIGGGKSLSVLAALQEIRPIGHILVIAPINIARSTWIDEIENWGFPIRTRSLIVDENDKQLSKDQRLERFNQVLTDPPSMYFVNQELLTQSSHPTHKLVAVPGVDTSAFSSEELIPLEILQQGPLTRDELVTAVRQGSSKKPPSKKLVGQWISTLQKQGVIERRAFDCQNCAGAGCNQCCFGLIDQMPTQTIVDASGKKREQTIWPFQTVIIDESQEFSNHASKRFKALKRMRPAITRVIELTGTPSPNGLHDLWSQIYLLDEGEALGHNITAFRNRWFTPQMAPGTSTPAKWIPNPGAEKEIYKAISHLVMSAKNTSLTLEDPVEQLISLDLSEDLLSTYKEFKRDLVLDVVDRDLEMAARVDFDRWLTTGAADAKTLSDELAQLSEEERTELYESSLQQHAEANHRRLVTTVVADNQAVLTSKLMQFASGTLYTADPDDPFTKGRYEILHDVKIQAVKTIVRHHHGDSILLAYHFRSDKEQIMEKLTEAGIHVEAFDGSRAMIRRWNAKQIPVMLLHPASAGPGLNLQHGGSILIWYTLPFSLRSYQQLNGRLHRTGQTQRVRIFILTARGTQDERVPSVLREKFQVQENLKNAVEARPSGADPVLSALHHEIDDDIASVLDPSSI